VSRDIDTVVDRILGTPPRHHRLPLVTARDVATELAMVGEDEALLDEMSSSAVDMTAVPGAGMGSATLDPPPALLPASRPRATPLPPPVEPPEAGASRRAARSALRTHRRLLGVGVALLLLLVASLAYAVGRQSAQEGGTVDLPTPPSGATSEPRANADVVRLEVKSVRDFDPQGTDGGENPRLAGLVADGDPATGWRTSQYRVSPQLGNLKDGVGVLLDLGRERTISFYDVAFAGAPTTYQLYASPAGARAAPTSLAELGEPFEQNTADNSAQRATRRMELRPAVTTRYVVLWLTSLPEEADGSGTYRGEVRELRLVGVVP
jgi:putative peptidoglycan lipid II flippase